MSDNKAPLLNREISWLYFNSRVLQEAADKTVPLIERIRFLAIFSSNLDEFYRVRVANLNRLADISSKTKEELGFNPKKILKEIKRTVVRHEHKFNLLYAEIIDELAANKIFILNEKQLNVTRGIFVRSFFSEKILSAIVPLILTEKLSFPELKDQYLYFFIKIIKEGSKPKYALIEVPKSLNRFLVLPDTHKLKFIILIDDVIRYNLEDIFFSFEYDKIECYGIQVTRDAEFELENQVSEKFIEALTKSLQKRKKGKPMRLLYDSDMPHDMLDIIIKQLNLKSESLIPGNRYQNFKDFIKFPNVGRPDLEYEPLPSLPVSGLSYNSGIIERVKKKDFLINLPYQSFDYIIHFLRESAIDPKVIEIQVTLYRLAENSKIINALINASRNGKRVYCLVELKARFDEEANIFWAKRLEEEGVVVSYGIPDYKVHSKICLVTRIEKGIKVYYASLSTGNFNESSAKIYGDHSLFTANKEITAELSQLFKAIEAKKVSGGYKELIVSPFDTRNKLFMLIDAEIANAKKSKIAYIILKMNSLDDEKTIFKLYEASNAGVKIKLIIRGMCSLVPNVKGFSENIEVISILDRFLEHARVWIFGNQGKEKVFLLSADLMTRNLDHRIEVGFPLYEEDIKEEIRDIIDIQLSDNTKAREINVQNNNRYKGNRLEIKVRSQLDTYKYLKAKHSH